MSSYQLASISFSRIGRIWGALVSMALCLALSTAAAKADEAKFSLDHPFTLVDADDKPITSADFHGKWLLIYFGYTHCSDQCPTALSAMAEALDEIGPAADHIQPLFITVDPERDRGLMLRDFTVAFDKRPIGLTGTQEQITDIARALGVKYEKVLLDNEDYVVDHSSTLSVIDLVHPARVRRRHRRDERKRRLRRDQGGTRQNQTLTDQFPTHEPAR